MNYKDKITVTNGNLHICFNASGSFKNYSIVPIDEIRRIELDDRSKPSNLDLVITNNSSKKIILDRFQNDVLAKQALLLILKKIKLFNFYSQLKRLFKWSILWIYSPIMFFLTILVLNYAISVAIINMGSSNNQPVSKITSLPINNSLKNSTPRITEQIDVNQLQKLPISNNQLASLLQEGVNSNKFTVNLSPDSSYKKTSIYVFSDPLCSHCKKLEYQLKKLTKDYEIVIFPVSIIGKDRSANKIAQVLCSSSPREAWENAIDGQSKTNNACETGYLALEANNKIFRTMGFLGTPTIISSAGHLYPLNKPFTAEEISNWIQNN